MFSLKNYIQPPQALDINDILNVISNSNVYCRDPVYQSRLLNDIRMLEPLVEKILQNKFFNLTFLYTVCVPVEDFTNNEKLSSKSFIGLMNMWDDLRQQITASTVVARKSFFNDAFNRRLLSQTKIVEHFRQVCNSLSNPEETPIDNFFIKPDLIDHKFFLNNDNDHAKLASFQTRNENLNRTLKYLELVTQEILIQLGIPCMNTFSEINGWDTQFLMNKDDVDPGLIQDAIKNKRIALNKIRINSYNMKENDDLISNLKDLLNSESFTLQYGTSARIDILSCIERVTSLKTYQAFRYHHLIGSLDTGCLWRDTDYTDNMDDFIHYIWEHKNEQFIERLMTDQLTNTSVNIDFLLNIIKVFANYDSSFPQFFFKFFEVNRTKYRVLSEVDSSKFSYQEFTKTQTYLYDMLACINSIIKLINNPEETNLYFKLLSKMLANQLRNQQFMFEKFVDPKTSDSFLQSLNKVANILDIYEKATSNIDMEELQRYMDEISLSGDGIHLSHTTHKLSELQKKYSEASVNFRLLKRFMQDKIINLNDIDSYNVPEMPINANIQKLTDIADMYTVDMTKILIKERSQYLIQSGWLDSIDEHFTLFAKDALEMRINLECDAREYAQSLTGILGKFIEGIELISNNDANWNFKA